MIEKPKKQEQFYLVRKDLSGWSEVRNKKTGEIMTWDNRTSCQVAKCKIFGIGKKEVKMYKLLPSSKAKELIKDWSEM